MGGMQWLGRNVDSSSTEELKLVCCDCRFGSGHSADICTVWCDSWATVGWKHAISTILHVQHYACR